MSIFSKKPLGPLFLGLILLGTLAACSNVKTTEAYTNPYSDILKQEKSEGVFGDGLTFGKSKKDDAQQGGAGIGVNAYLWRAALDTTSFLPLASADPFGGVVITDWYAPTDDSAGSADERFKLTVYILSKELRADGLRVAAFKQSKDKTGNWTDSALDADTASRIENAILSRARELRVAAEGR